jgi:hypothetical protein
MAEGKFTNAILDDDGVLIGFETVTDELLHVRSANRYPWPNNEPDLAPKRYRLVRDTSTGKEKFTPIVHDKDEPEENVAPSVQVNPAFVARALLKLNSGKKLTKADERKLKEYLNSFDVKGMRAN